LLYIGPARYGTEERWLAGVVITGMQGVTLNEGWLSGMYGDFLIWLWIIRFFSLCLFARQSMVVGFFSNVITSMNLGAVSLGDDSGDGE